MGEKVWLEINIDPNQPTGPKDAQPFDGYYKTSWQWRGGRCTSNGSAYTVEDAVGDAFEALQTWQELSGE